MADLITGADSVGGEAFCDDIYNSLKNHWRADYSGDPCGELSGIVPGMIVNDAYDNRLYLALLESGCACSEILQSCVPLSNDKTIDFGNDADGSLGYNELTNDALIFGLPIDPKRGLIFCDIADIGGDFTGLITATGFPEINLVDLDIDSRIRFSFASDDTPEIMMQSQAYYNLIQTSQAEGLAGADLRIGLDESNRTMIICDRGDIATDFGLGASGEPKLVIYNATGTIQSTWNRNYLGLGSDIIAFQYSSSSCSLISYAANGFVMSQCMDIPIGNLFTISSIPNVELTDTNAEQAWMYLEPKINMGVAPATGNYVGLLMDVIETALGDGSASGHPNALVDLRVATVSKFLVDNSGGIFPAGMKSGATQIAAGAAAGELWWDTDDTLVKMGV